ncbi:MAG: flagellar motor protein MotB [Vicinamibacterales bacterium]
MMHRRRDRRKEMSEGVRDRWVISYADFVTLLFAFFTTMYAASSVDATKMSGVAVGLQTAFDTTLPPPAPSVALDGAGAGVLAGARPSLDGQMVLVRAAVEAELFDAIKAGQVEVNRDRRGLIVSIPESGAFPIGSADLSPALADVMRRLSYAVERLPNGIRVEGHTDDVPINTPRFASNWELSAERSIQVVKVLIESGAVSPARLSVAGYGEYRPRVPNTDAKSRSRNRRVDIIILNADTGAAEEPEAPGAPAAPGAAPSDPPSAAAGQPGAAIAEGPR